MGELQHCARAALVAAAVVQPNPWLLRIVPQLLLLYLEGRRESAVLLPSFAFSPVCWPWLKEPRSPAGAAQCGAVAPQHEQHEDTGGHSSNVEAGVCNPAGRAALGGKLRGMQFSSVLPLGAGHARGPCKGRGWSTVTNVRFGLD